MPIFTEKLWVNGLRFGFYYGLRFRSNRFKHLVKRFGRFGLDILTWFQFTLFPWAFEVYKDCFWMAKFACHMLINRGKKHLWISQSKICKIKYNAPNFNIHECCQESKLAIREVKLEVIYYVNIFILFWRLFCRNTWQCTSFRCRAMTSPNK